MQNIKQNLKEHKFRLHLTALLMMLVPPIPLYFAAEAGAFGLVWVMVAIIVLGNVLVIIVP